MSMETFSRYLGVVRSACAPYIERVLSMGIAGVAIAILLLGGAVWSLIAPPSLFVENTIVRIESGASVPEIATLLAGGHIISHPTVLRAVLRIAGQGTGVQAGVYRFATKENVLTVAYRLVAGEYGLPPVRSTFIEGETIRDMAAQVEKSFPDVTAEEFLRAAEGQEGYLFPDTYFFQPGADAASIVKTLRDNFTTQTEPLSDAIRASGRTLSEIVTMASLIEKEARTSVDQHLISGILWNRIKIGMPLQVDAVFGYIFGRDTYSPSPADLKVNSPYNTYTHKGLPPGPIGNPGFAALEAATNPTKTSYLYYLTGNDGHTYYATTYVGHQTNLRKYLR